MLVSGAQLALWHFVPFAVLGGVTVALVQRRRAIRWRALAGTLGLEAEGTGGRLADPEVPLSGTLEGLPVHLGVSGDPQDYEASRTYVTRLVASPEDLDPELRIVVRPTRRVGGFARPGVEDVWTIDDDFHAAYHLRSNDEAAARDAVGSEVRERLRDLEALDLLEVRDGTLTVVLAGIVADPGIWQGVGEIAAEICGRLGKRA